MVCKWAKDLNRYFSTNGQTSTMKRYSISEMETEASGQKWSERPFHINYMTRIKRKKKTK